MDDPKKLALVEYVQAAMERTGKDATNLARAIGVEPSTLTRPLQPGWKGGLSRSTLAKIEQLSGLAVPPPLLRVWPRVVEAHAAAPTPADRRGLLPVRASRRGQEQDLLPVRASRGGQEQEMFLADRPVDYVPRPYVLERVNEAYAIYMASDTMSPRYEPDFTLYVHPFKPPRAGNGVVVHKKNDAVLVALFKAMGTDELIVEQLNPPQELRISRAALAHVHLIVHVDEAS